MIKRVAIPTALLTVSVFLPVGLTSLAQQTQSTSQQTQPKISALDRQFIIDAAQGGMAEVRLGQLATQRATSNAVKQYGQRMVQEHTQANNELLRLATQKGVTPPTDMGPRYQAVMARLSQLPKPSFDKAYLTEAGINSHIESAVVYQREIQLGQDQNLKAFASRILPKVEEHFLRARDLGGTIPGTNRNLQGVK